MLDKLLTKTKKSPLRVSILLCLSIVIVFYCFFRPFFNVNDDCFKIFFAKGVGTNLYPSEFIGYSSIPLGFILKWLYSVFPIIPWYGLCLISAQVLGIWLFLYSLFLRSNALLKLILFFIGFIAADIWFFSNLQFTISSSLVAQGGLFLWARIMEKDNSEEIPGGFVLVLISAILSALIRFDEFLVTLFCALPFIFYSFPRNRIRMFKTSMVPYLFLLISILFCIPIFSGVWHEHKPGWHDFDLFDHERVEFQDYRIRFYTPITKPYFDEAGWSENDFEMFKDWYFMDREKYDWKNVHRLNQHFSRIGVDGKGATFHSISEIAQSDFGKGLLPLLFCLLLFLPVIEFRWLLISIVWVVAFIYYMLYFWRAPDRLVFQELYYLLCVGVFWAEGPDSQNLSPTKFFPNLVRKTGLVFLIIFTLNLFPSLMKLYSDNQANIRSESQLKMDVAQMKPQDNQLFIIWDSAFPYELFDAFDSYETFRQFHIFEFAVYQRSPDASPLLKKFGLENPLVDMIGKPNVFFICKPEELKMYGRYLTENHPRKVLASVYFDSRFFRVFKMAPYKSKTL